MKEELLEELLKRNDITLLDHQLRFLKRDLDRALVCWGTGTGKTIGSIAWSLVREGSNSLIVICLKSLKKNWQRNLERYIGGRKKWIVMTKEEFKRDYKKIGKYDEVIIDEAHVFAGLKSGMNRALGVYLKYHDIKYRLMLTASPYTSSPWSIFALANLLGRGWSLSGFQNKFFVEKVVGRKDRFDASRKQEKLTPEELDKRLLRVLVPRKGIENDVADLTRLIGDIVSMEDCVDVPEQQHLVEFFDLTKEQEVAKKNIMDVMPIVKFTKYSCIENGVLNGDEYNEDQVFPSYKIDRALDIVSENKKVAIICRYNLQIDRMNELLITCGKPVYIIRGAVKDRDSVVLAAEAAEECVVLIQADCAEGYQLPSISVCVFMSMSYSLVKYTQMLGRFLRIDKIESGRNTFIYLLTDGESIDNAVFDCIMNKQDFSLAIYLRRYESTNTIQIQDWNKVQ